MNIRVGFEGRSRKGRMAWDLS
jgi:hypothetical protein